MHLVTTSIDEVTEAAIEPHESILINSGEITGVDKSHVVGSIFETVCSRRRLDPQQTVITESDFDSGMRLSD
jgi:hypothetical protein